MPRRVTVDILEHLQKLAMSMLSCKGANRGYGLHLLPVNTMRLDREATNFHCLPCRGDHEPIKRNKSSSSSASCTGFLEAFNFIWRIHICVPVQILQIKRRDGEGMGQEEGGRRLG